MADPKIKTNIRSKTQSDKMHDGKEIGAEMDADPDGDVSSAGNKLLAKSNTMETKNTQRNQLLSDAKQLTGELNDLEEEWDDLFATAAAEAERIYPGDDNKWAGYGFEPEDTDLTTKAAPAKVENMKVTPGDEVGEVDLVWNPLNRETIDGYYLQINITEPLDHNEWTSADPISVSKSKATIVGLTSGQKYFVRVVAFIKDLKGPSGDEEDVIAP